MEYVWNNPRCLSIKKFKRITKNRIKTLSLKQSKEELKALKSHQLLNEVGYNKNCLKELSKLDTRSEKRLFIKMLLDQFEDCIVRTDNIKRCKKCNQIIYSRVGFHLLSECTANKDLMQKFSGSVGVGNMTPKYLIQNFMVIMKANKSILELSKESS